MDGGSTEDAGGGSFAGLGSLEGWRAYGGVVVWCLVFCGSVLLNSTLLVPFIRRPGLRTISNRFVMNLIASNLLVVAVLTGLLVWESCGSEADGAAGWSGAACSLSEGATALVTTSSILSVLLIGLDQYLAVVDPLRYRTRIDKLKCGLLIGAVWLVALGCGALAGLNPQPRSLCPRRPADPLGLMAGLRGVLVEAGNASEIASIEIEGLDGEEADEDEDEDEDEADEEAAAAGGTYGLVFALAYALVGYLLPFLAICWIYASIYVAARSNSERTRRNGSRPGLSSASLAGPEADSSLDDLRRIPKISSLSSIDENSESCPSQLGPAEQQQQQQQPVVFTLGQPPADAAGLQCKVPIAELRAKFLGVEEQRRLGAPSRFPEVAEQRRKSSHDLMYEEMLAGGHPYEYEPGLHPFDSSSDEEDVDVVDEEDEEEGPGRGEEAEPLSARPGQPATARSSVSVNFDLGPEPPAVVPIVTITPPGQRPAAGKPASNGYINNLKYKISNGSLFVYREETRAARISALVVVMGLICWTPYVYVLLARNLPSAGAAALEPRLALGFLVLATYLSPLLFGYRSRRVKRELRKFFCFKRELSYKNNRSLMAKKVLRRRHSGAVEHLAHPAHEQPSAASRYSIFNCMYARNKWPKDKVQFVQVPDTALAVETCRSSFSSGASTQISSTSTDEC